jgi:hypothetical protein
MKKVFLILAAVISLSVPMGVFAATSDSGAVTSLNGFCAFGINAANLTEQQKADLDEAFEKMIEVRKETINKMVQDGLLTKEQGDLALERLDERVEYHNENGYGYGMGMMGAYGYGRGMRGNYNGNSMMRGYWRN